MTPTLEKEPSVLSMSSPKISWLARRLLSACGVGRVLLIANAPVELMAGLLLTGADVHALVTDEDLAEAMRGHFPGRVLDSGDVDDLRFDAVIVLADDLKPADGVPPVLAPWLARFERSLAVVFTGESANFEARAQWEQLFIHAGLRKHPMIEVVANYSSLDEPADPMVLLFEPVPQRAAEAYPLEVLIEERDLHTDMTREPGRRSDAHMTRYAQAAQFVRAGDRVLDLACGLGYGSHILANATQASSLVGLDASEYAVKYAATNFGAVSAKPMEFREGDAEKLDFLDDGSVDFAVSVETLEHLYHPEALLAELMRVLTPGGRAYLSVPFDWSDETGQDPNPFHHHVYDWSVLERQVVDAGFLVEKAWTQDAGGGQKLHHAKRVIREFNPATGPEADGEWLLALVMKPLGESRLVLPERADVPNILAFDRDYHNASLVRGLVSIGWRATSNELLRVLAERTLAQATPSQADFGAALCVSCYLALTKGSSYSEKQSLAERAMAYAEQDPANPTVLRWQVSLTFVAGLLHLSGGNRAAARAAFQQVARFDVRPFSPLLGTKTVAAYSLLGQMALADGSQEQARSWWEQAVVEVQRLLADIDWREVIGPADGRQAFGMPELADMLLTAAKAVNGLAALRHGTVQPGLLWQLVHNTLDSRAESFRTEGAILQESFDVHRRYYEERERSNCAAFQELLQSKDWLDGQYHHLTGEVSRLGKINQSLAESREWLEGQYHSLTTALAGPAGRVTLAADRDALLQAKEWLDGQYHSLTGEVAELGKLNRELIESNQWLEAQYHSLTAAVAAAHGTAAEDAQATTSLAQAKAWLEEQYHTLTHEVARLGAESQGLLESKQWLESQYHSLTAALTQSTVAYDLLRAGNAEIVKTNQILSEALESAAGQVAAAQAQVAVHRADADAARVRIEYLEMNPIRRVWARLKSGRSSGGRK